MNDLRAYAQGSRAAEMMAEKRAGVAQQNPDLELRHVRAALKPLLDKLDALEVKHGATYLAADSTVLTNVGVLREIRAAVGRADG